MKLIIQEPEIFPKKEDLLKLELNQWYLVKGYYNGEKMYWEFKKMEDNK